MKRILLFFLLCHSLVSNAQKNKPAPFHTSTHWRIIPSFKYDVLCLLNTLTADSFYLRYYQKEYDVIKDKITPEASQALSNLKYKIKDKGNGIISAFLCLYFSTLPDSSLTQMMESVKNNSLLKSNLKATIYYDENDWVLFESVKDDLLTVFAFLEQIQFKQYWSESVYPKIAAGIKKIEPELPKYNIINAVENHLGYVLTSDTITVNMLYYAQPHGIKVTGTAFLTDVAWPFSIVLRNAVHEMMHPPYDIKQNKKLQQAIAKLQQDPFLKENFDKRNSSFGYNTFEGLIEEDCVQALEQIINEKLGIATDAKNKWKYNDDGLHKFAVLLYSRLKKDMYPQKQVHFSEYLLQLLQGLKNTKEAYADFYK